MKFKHLLITAIIIIAILSPIPSIAKVSEQSPMDRILQQQRIEKQQEQILKKSAIKKRLYSKKQNQRTSEFCIKVKIVKFQPAQS